MPETTGLGISALAEQYLAVLRDERGVSVHTLRAYTRELHDFTEWIRGRRAGSILLAELHRSTGAPIRILRLQVLMVHI